MKKSDLGLHVRFEYEQAPDMSLTYAHGVWGGVNPQGEVEMNFYTESDKFPEFSERMVEPDGGIGEETAHYGEHGRSIVRRINSKLILNYHTARAVCDWLEDKLALLEAEAEDENMLLDSDMRFQ